MKGSAIPSREGEFGSLAFLFKAIVARHKLSVVIDLEVSVCSLDPLPCNCCLCDAF